MEIIRLETHPLHEAAAKAAQVLARGGVVLYPTDTLYGLAVDALNKDAIMRLKQLKARETKKPVSVVVPHHDAVERYTRPNDRARSLIEAHLPGPLTLVLPATDAVPGDILHNGMLGIRIPDDPFPLALAQAFGRPYTATSANISGIPTQSEVREILAQFGPRIAHIDLVIDAGPRDAKLPSTVLLVQGEDIHVLREGALTREALGL